MGRLLTVVSIVGVISALETISQSAIKTSFIQKNHLWIVGLVGYAIVCAFLYHAYNFESMSLVNAWWNIITSLSVTLAGVFIFGEKLRGTDMLGIAMILTGATFLSIQEMGIM